MTTKKSKKSDARKTSKIPTKIYTYGISSSQFSKLFPDSFRLVQDQLFLAHCYKNKLIEIERERRTKYRELRKSLSETAESLEKKNDEWQNKIDAEYKKLQSIKDETGLHSIHRSTRKNSSEAQEIKNNLLILKQEQKKINEDAKKEFARIEKECFVEGDIKYKNLHDKLSVEFLAKKGNADAIDLLNSSFDSWNEEVVQKLVKTLAPRDQEKITLRVRQEMKEMDISSAWLEKLKLQEEAGNKRKDARDSCGCFPGTYQKVEEAVNRSFKDSQFLPKFQKFTGEGIVALQIQSPHVLVVSDAFSGQDDRLKIEIITPIDEKKEKRHAIIRMRLGEVNKGKNGKKAYLDLPVVLHRPLPEDSEIKWICVKVNKIGTRSIFELQFTLESKSFIKNSPTVDGTVAINLGWRVLENGNVRVATTWDGENSKVIELPFMMREKNNLAKHLLSVSDKLFDEVKLNFSQWCKKTDLNILVPIENQIQAPRKLSKKDSNNCSNPIRLNETLMQKFEYCSNWRAHGKLAFAAFILRKLYLSNIDWRKFWQDWKNKRLESSQEKSDLFDSYSIISTWLDKEKGITDDNVKMALYLEWWRRKDEHLVNWARSIQNKIRLWKREIFRTTAAQLNKEYKNVVVEQWDKRKTAQNPQPELDHRSSQEIHGNAVRQEMGVSVLAEILQEKFGTEYFQKESAKDITCVHFGCGGNCSNPSLQINVKCDKCSEDYDQDVNAAKHLWSRNCGRPGGDEDGGVARKGQVRERKGEFGSESVMTDNHM